jgi:uncharacterized repeat protein (TIGR03803 family)
VGGAETVLYDFAGSRKNTADPQSELVEDSAGNLYGTARYRGDGRVGGCGYVYRIAPDHTESVLHKFKSGRDGCYPSFGLTADGTGNFYGLTSEGGGGRGNDGCGIVYKISSEGQESVVYRFKYGTTDGCTPSGGVALDHAGNIFGPTRDGGIGYGVVFKVASDGTESVVHSFSCCKKDGGLPYGYTLLDKSGNLYGTMSAGTNTCFCGAVFRITANGKETVLYSFTGGSDGKYVNGGLVIDDFGNLYGTTSGGGANSLGAVFEISAGGAETALHSFAGGIDGSYPSDGLTSDQSGNLYGVTSSGGQGCSRGGCGVIYEISP